MARFVALVFVLLTGVVLTDAEARAQAVASGADFQVNTYTTSAQSGPDVAVDGSGRFVVVWRSFGSSATDTDNFSIRSRRYDAALAALGADFEVNTYTGGAQTDARVGIADDGSFTIVWESAGSGGSDADGQSVQLQRYAATGAVSGGELEVNAYTAGDQHEPDVAMAPDGRFVVVWESAGSDDSDSSGSSIQGQLFDGDGFPVGGQFQVNTYTTGGQSDPAVAMSDAGSFVVVWEGPEPTGSYEASTGIFAQRFDAVGGALGAELQVNGYTTGAQSTPAVAMAPNGRFVVVWRSAGSPGTDQDEFSVLGRVFSPSGTPNGADFQANTYTTARQQAPAVAVGPAGDFVVVWHTRESALADSGSYGIVGRLFDAAGGARGGEYQVNSYITGTQANPNVAADGDGSFVVVWRSDNGPVGEDNDNSAVRARHFSGLGRAPFFADGFESGDTTGWSSAVP